MSKQLPAIIDRAEISGGDTYTPVVPALVAAAGERASLRFREFFAANIRNPHAPRAPRPAPIAALYRNLWRGATTMG
jgi:hypothetical protein